MEHDIAPLGEIHPTSHWRPADAAERAALSVTEDDVGKEAWQQDNNTFWVLKSAEPPEWVVKGGGGESLDIIAIRTFT
jgi:hypothetical protein